MMKERKQSYLALNIGLLVRGVIGYSHGALGGIGADIAGCSGERHRNRSIFFVKKFVTAGFVVVELIECSS